MRRAPAIAILLAIAACSPKPGPPENQATANEKLAAEANVSGNIAEASVEPANNAAVSAQPSGTLSPTDAGPRFVGTWAASKAECTSKPWKFTADALSGSGPHCNFYKVSKAPGGYDIAATCPAKEPVHADLIKLRFAESAGAMLVESNAIAPSGLIYCGR